MKIIKQLSSVFLLLLLLSSCKTTAYKATKIDVEYERVGDAQLAPDPEVEGMVKDYRRQLEAEMNVAIGELEVELIKQRPESNIGNWMVDMMHEETNLLVSEPVDFSIQNQGGIRVSSIGAGPILVGEIFEVMPFDNKISIMTGSGEDVINMMNHVARGRGWPLSSQVSMKIKDREAIDILIDGKPVDKNKTYRFALPDYIANGGSGTDFLGDLHREDLDVLIRDVLIDNIKKDTKKGLTQHPQIEGRIINLDHE